MMRFRSTKLALLGVFWMAVCGVAAMPRVALAWPTAPVINCDIGTNEYGTSNAFNYQSGTPHWYMTWNDDYVYISIQNANETEAGIVYFDLGPLAPVNGGNAANGSLTGQSYDGLTPDLPFRADAVIYFKNNFRELRRWNGSNAWSSISSGNGGLSGTSDDYNDNSYCSNNRGNGAGSDDDRELRVSWCRLTGGSSNCRPSSFNWNSYIAYTNGVYGQVPSENPSGTLGAGSTPDFIRYFTVSVTADGSQTNPMSRNSYTHIGDTITNFGSTGVWDFTMNTSDKSITRSSGDWTISGDFRVDSGTVNFGSTSGSTTTGNVVVGANGTLDLATSTGGFTVSGAVTNNGTLKQTKTVDANSTVDFLNVSTNKYYGVQIAAGGTALGSTTVSVSGNQTCSQATGYPVKRCFNVSPASQQSANIKFYYQETEMQTGQTYSSLNVWNYHGGTWNAVTRGGDGGPCGDGAINCYVQGNNISTYSPFALKNTSPTAITLADFYAAQQGDAVLVTWETASELNNRGFNLYRGTSPAGHDRQLNAALIPSQSQGNPGGFVYIWLDEADLIAGTTYYYWLEDLDLSGATTMHGPVSVDFSVPTAVTLSDVNASPAAGAAALPWLLVVAGAGAALALGRRR